MSPLANSYVARENLQKMEPFYPLHAFICDQCFLVQLQEFESPQSIFSDYAYFSSYSQSWLEHASNYVDMMVERFGFDTNSQIVEVASNDGYLLQYFKKKNIPVLGIEPAANVAKVAIAAGIPSITEFFGEKTATDLAASGKRADLLLGNNVLAHVPDLNDFVKGLKILLNETGVITLEFPHLQRLIEQTQFDTIYHEHFSYFSCITIQKVFSAHGLALFDVDELGTHGGSLRVYARHEEDNSKPVSSNVSELIDRETALGYADIEFYLYFESAVIATKQNLLTFLIQAKREDKNIVGYGAAAKGNTLLNYCGVRTDFIDYVVDRSPHKQGHSLPGTHIPIYSPDRIKETKPDYLLILPWNLKQEVMQQMHYVREWGCRFVTFIPDVDIAP
jgi:SAM-dependent methyltransferase